MQDYQTALRAIVKILSPQSPAEARRAFAVKLAEAGNGEIHKNLVFYYWHIGALFHPNDPAAANALSEKMRAGREAGEIQSIIPRDRGGILVDDLLTWSECPPVTADNPLSFWLPVSAATSGTPEKAVPPVVTPLASSTGIASAEIIERFRLAAEWSEKLRKPDSYKYLLPALAQRGQRGGDPHRWNPAKFGAILIERRERNLLAVSTVIFHKFAEWGDEWQTIIDATEKGVL